MTGATGGLEPDGPGGGSGDPPGPKRRLRGFGTHLAVYFGTMVVLVPVNFFLTPENPWFVLPMVGWGSVLAIHAAYAMGLFRVFTGGPPPRGRGSGPAGGR